MGDKSCLPDIISNFQGTPSTSTLLDKNKLFKPHFRLRKIVISHLTIVCNSYIKYIEQLNNWCKKKSKYSSSILFILRNIWKCGPLITWVSRHMWFLVLKWSSSGFNLWTHCNPVVILRKTIIGMLNLCLCGVLCQAPESHLEHCWNYKLGWKACLFSGIAWMKLLHNHLHTVNHCCINVVIQFTEYQNCTDSSSAATLLPK